MTTLAVRPSSSFSSVLPGQAKAAIVIGWIYVALSVVGMIQVLAIAKQIKPADRGIVAVAMGIGVLVTVALVVGVLLLAGRRTATPLKVIAATVLGTGIMGLLAAPGLARLLDIAVGITLVILLNNENVKDFFAERAV